MGADEDPVRLVGLRDASMASSSASEMKLAGLLWSGMVRGFWGVGAVDVGLGAGAGAVCLSMASISALVETGRAMRAAMASSSQ